MSLDNIDWHVQQDDKKLRQIYLASEFEEETKSTVPISNLGTSEVIIYSELIDEPENIAKNTSEPVLPVAEIPVKIEEIPEDIVIISRKPQVESENLTVTEDTSQSVEIFEPIEEVSVASWDEQTDILDEPLNSWGNRIVIPKIDKDIPLIDIQDREASSSSEWNDIMLKELENGVVKYPGSAYPGEVGNSFIFGHSSNFSWAEGAYNDVFAQLGELHEKDEIIIYFEQEKYVYRVINTQVVRPGYVDKSDNEWKKLLTLMTCWPVGTTLNRLLITWELVDL